MTILQLAKSLGPKIVRAVSEGVVTPIVTPAILAEYAEVMSRSKFQIAPETVSATLGYFRERGRNVTPVAYSQKLPDEKDRAFLEAALALLDEDAVLVTGNVRHFPSAPFVVSPAEFAASLEDLDRRYCAVSRMDAMFIPSIMERI